MLCRRAAEREGNLTFEIFLEQVRERILDYMPKDYEGAEVTVDKAVRANDLKLHELRIRKKGEYTATGIFLESFYRRYRDGLEMGEVLSALAGRYTETAECTWDLRMQDFSDFAVAKDRLCVAVLNKRLNTQYLKNAIYREVPGTDLVSVVRMHIDTGQGKAGILVEDRLLEKWGLTAQELYDMAFENTIRLFKPSLVPMDEIMLSSLGGVKVSGIESDPMASVFKAWERGCDDPMKGMFILTNTANYNGAAVLLYPGLLEKIGEKAQSSFFILPSSTHEMILLNENEVDSAEKLQEMVMEINRQCVRFDEILSDEVYHYDHQERRLTMATDPERTAQIAETMEALIPDPSDWSCTFGEQEEEER